MNIIPNENGGEDLILQEVPVAVSRTSRFGRWLLRFHPDGLYFQEPDNGVEHLLGRWSKILFVDSVKGNDATAQRGNLTRPYLTIEGAIAAALSGDLIWIGPGIYELAAGIAIPDGVSVRGISTKAVTIQKTGVTADTTLITMGNNTRLEDVALKITSTGHHTLTGVKFGGTTSATAKLRTATIEVDESGAGAGASNVTGILVQSTGTPDRSVNALRAVTVTVKAAGTGTKRGILVNTSACNFSMRDVNVLVTGSGIGVESNFAGVVLTAGGGFINGVDADISQTLGTVEVNGVALINANANGLGFTALNASSQYQWGVAGAVANNATLYLWPGARAESASEILRHVSRPAILKTLAVHLGTAPGVGKTDTWTLRKNGVDTGLTVSITGTATDGNVTDVSVSFASGDHASLKQVTDNGTATSDVIVDVEVY